MSNKELSSKEIENLEILYLNGELTKEEEKALFLVLNSTEKLSGKGKSLLEMMKIEKKIYDGSRKRSYKSYYFSMAAASVILLFSVGLLTFHNLGFGQKEETYIVWQNGERLSEDEAKKIAEEQQQNDMEMIRQVMRCQREMIKRNFASVDMENYDL